MTKKLLYEETLKILKEDFSIIIQHKRIPFLLCFEFGTESKVD